MRVFFGRINDPSDILNKETYSRPGDDGGFFGGMKEAYNANEDAYAFISENGNVSRLWKVANINIDATTNNGYAKFSEVLEFNTKKRSLEFCSLSMFKIDVNTAAMVRMPNGGFLELQLVDEVKFINLISDLTNFESFINDNNNYRKIVFLKDLNNVQESDIDIQIYKDGTKYKIYNKNKSFLNSGNKSLSESFDEDSYLKIVTYLKQNPNVDNNNRQLSSHKKVKRWLKSEGNNENIIINDLWCFGCSDNVDYRTIDVSGIVTTTNNINNVGVPMSNINLKDKIEEYIVNKNCKQIILTGAPGTGKTYSAKEYAGRGDNVKFVQFHPSFDYSDFVEGLRPVMLVGNVNPTFVRVDGIFKAFCRKVVEENYVKEYGKTFEDIANDTSFSEKDKYEEFKNKYGELEKKLDEKTKNSEVTAEVLNLDNEEKVDETAEALNLDNEEKVDESAEALNLDNEINHEKDCQESNDSQTKYFFIIDEINRADLSKVFGELMYCLEDSYRGLKDKSGNYNLISTQYSNLPTYVVNENCIAEKVKFDCFKDGFFIPKNVYIIGTMNDIDRSVEAFDFALRRRFEWLEIKANDVFYNGARGMLPATVTDNQVKELAEKVSMMNDIISRDGNPFMLTEAYHIGHAYFKKYDGTKESLEKIFDTNITSILKEYTRGRNNKFVEENLITPCRNALLSGVE